MDWRKYNLVEYRKGRYRLERQTWSFWDWCLALFAVAVLWRLGWLGLIAAGVGVVLMAISGLILFAVSRLK